MFDLLNKIASSVEGWFERLWEGKVKFFLEPLMHEPAVNFRYQTQLFWLGLFIFVFVQAGISLKIYENRALPPEIDDAYGIIGKSSQLDGCFFQDCPAMETLRAQLSVPSSDLSPVGTSYMRERTSFRTLINYNPFYSLILFLIFKAIGSWEIAFQGLSVTGIVFIAFSLAFWLRYLFGDGVAGIALLLLSGTTSYTHITPMAIAVGLFALLWALILTRSTKYSEWILLFGSLALLGLHPFGRFYVLILVFLYWLEWRAELFAARKFVLVSAVLLVFIFFLLPYFIDRPLLKPFPGSYSDHYVRTVEVYKQELLRDMRIMKGFFRSFGNPIPLLVLLLTGVFYLNKRNFLALVLLVGLAASGIVFSFPGYPGTLFERVWRLLNILLTGYIALGYWRIFLYVIDLFAQARAARPLKSQWLVWLGVASLLWLFGYNLYDAGNMNMRARAQKIDVVTERQDYWFDSTQTDFIQSLTSDQCGHILYFSEAVRDYFLAHGALSCGAIDYISVINSPEETKWLVENQNLKYAVAVNPIVKLSLGHNGAIVLNPGEKILISTIDGSPIQNPVYLLFADPEKMVKVDVDRQPGNGVAIIRRIKPGDPSWIKLPSEGYSRLSISSPKRQVALMGIRLGGAASKLFWPWDGNLMFSVISNGTVQGESVQFQLEAYGRLLPEAGQYKLEVLMDSGDSILIGINR